MKFEVVSDILCHSELTTTQRYARVVDNLRDQEMDKWDKLAKDENDLPVDNEVICLTCENPITKIDTSIIKLKKIPMTCPYCDHSFTYDVDEHKLETKVPVLSIAKY